ncbi:MAG: transposase [Sphingobacteriaceae bacterium]|jgi:REP element-mobilizing transposase RayT|nr:transposase [Sphingobacteriaceae bacterium]
MSHQYRVKDHDQIHFVTFTVVDWVDIFTRQIYKQVIADALNYCNQQKGFNIHAYCLMTNHLHLLISANHPFKLPDIIRDFKKHTNKKLIAEIQLEPESRRDWIMYRFQYHAKYNNRIQDLKLWQDGYHAIECSDLNVLAQKLDYIHNNPVRTGIVAYPEHYLYSSAQVYNGGKGPVTVEVLDIGYAGIGNSV